MGERGGRDGLPRGPDGLAPPPGKRERRGRRPAFVTILLVLVILVAAGATVVVVAALGLAGDLRQGRIALDVGRRALLDGRISVAAASFEDARVRFRSAGDRAGSGLDALGGSLPVLGRTIDVLAALADAGERAGEAGVTMSTAIEDLPGGIEGLMSSEGVISLEALGPLGIALDSARLDVARASDVVGSSPEGLVPGPVADARGLALERLQEFEELLASARALSQALPGFAGGAGPRRYLFFAEDPAELRGTGGIWGAYAIVRAEDGRFSFSPFRPTQSLEDLPRGVVSPPNPDYRRNYEQYGAPGYWLNTNMTPDLPSAARVALATWEAIGKEPLDGVITADPFALQHLLTVTGRVRLPLPPLALTADNVVRVLSNRAFARFPDPTERKAVLGEAARAILARFLTIEGRAVPRLKALGRAVSEGHLKIFAADGSVESALARAGLDGALRADDGDLMSVIVNSGSGGKVDYFCARTVRHDVTLLDEGAAAATTRVTIENDAPTSGQPRYVIGPHVGEAGDDIPLLAMFCGPRCGLVRAERQGKGIALRTGTELGYRFYRDYFTIPSGQERSLVLTTETPVAWTGDLSGGSYRLTVIGQTTIRPTHVDIHVEAPTGMRFTEGSDGVSIDGDRAVWSGVLGDRLEVELAFERAPLLVRLWEAISGES